MLIYGEGGYFDKEFDYTLQLGQQQCLYDLKVGGRTEYLIYAIKANPSNKNYPNPSDYLYYATGQILIEQCKSKTFVIK